MALHTHYYIGCIEAGCDEAGRGSLAGSVVAAAVVLPAVYDNPLLDDSKKLSPRKRTALAAQIQREAVAWAVGACSAEEIDAINILHASILAMHRALAALAVAPEAIIVDGNRFTPYGDIPYTTIVKGDGRYQAIAAASVIAKTCRDEYMLRLSREYPMYAWERNKGYPTPQHLAALQRYGASPYHRKSFTLFPAGSLFSPCR